MDFTSRIVRAIREYSQWSRHERAHLDAIIDEILDHCRNGTGNKFIQKWCEFNLAHLFPVTWSDSGEGPFASEEIAREFAEAEVGARWRVVRKRDGYHVEVVSV